ncbi:hypothetical protein GCM10011506_47070 [Marivirga lumbricoides]|uniref:OmpA-like domain-containing protein n=1 Tax=Marivirga lumbricoides TaxID=1046115 RepID=A0ABQ1N6X2_9BACT|nr:hypothetical protein GCM10011506_47070 [Marivirga lumbricoides]
MIPIKKIIFTCVCITFGSHLLWSQSIADLVMSPESKGDKYFNQFAYKKAITSYEESLRSQKSDSMRGIISLKIAQSYNQLNQPEQASKWYAQAKETQVSVAAESLLNYAQSLAATGKYAQASHIFKELTEDEGVSASIKAISSEQINAIEEQNRFFINAGRVVIDKAAFNSKYSDFAPLLYDSLILFVSAREHKTFISGLFNWDESNYLDIFSYNPQNGEVKNFSKNLNTSLHEGPLTSYNNNKDIIFTRNTEARVNENTGDNSITKLQLYHAAYEDGKWSKGEPLNFNDPNFSFAHPSISSDGNTLYFASDIPGGMGGADLYKVQKDGDGQWGKPINLGAAVNTAGDEFFPTIHGERLYFASNGHGGLGGLDLFGYDLSKEGKVVNLGSPINSSLDDFGITFYEDGRSGYFSSNREESAFKDEIYQFKSDMDLMPEYQLILLVSDKLSQEIIKEAKVYLLSSQNDTITQLDYENGQYVSTQIEPNTNYKIITTSKEYFSAENDFTSLETAVDAPNTWKKSLSLVKDYDFGMTAFVFENNSQKKLDSVQVKLINNLGDEVPFKVYTDENGRFSYTFSENKLNDRVSYQIKLEKKGFLSKSMTYNKKLDKPGINSLNAMLDFGLNKIELGEDIGKLLGVEPIYFDLGKAIIRKDAAKELDKIVAAMKENPAMVIELGSHTDARGGDAFNLQLSDKRAKASAAYIVSKGIEERRIIGKGYGETQLMNECEDGVNCSEEAHQLNRRTEFKIISL